MIAFLAFFMPFLFIHLLLSICVIIYCVKIVRFFTANKRGDCWMYIFQTTFLYIAYVQFFNMHLLCKLICHSSNIGQLQFSFSYKCICPPKKLSLILSFLLEPPLTPKNKNPVKSHILLRPLSTTSLHRLEMWVRVTKEHCVWVFWKIVLTFGGSNLGGGEG